MPVYNRTITIAHTPENLFDLVSDIRAYPEFIRWIQSMRVSNQRIENEVMQCLGEARVGFKGFNELFATTVKADRANLRIQTRLVRGPFKHLENDWKFLARADGKTDVRFHIDYRFRNPLLQALLSANFDKAVRKLVEAFSAEADRRYARIEAVAAE